MKLGTKKKLPSYFQKKKKIMKTPTTFSVELGFVYTLNILGI